MNKITFIRRKTGKRNQHDSMLVTKTTTFKDGVPTSAECDELNKGWNVEILIEETRQDALSFLDDKKVPYVELPLGNHGLVGPDFLSRYDHIPGVRQAFQILFELHCFNLKRQDQSEEAYGHLLRAASHISLLTLAKLEAGYLAGMARAGDSEKTAQKLERQKVLLKHYADLRQAGKNPSEARRLAARRAGIPFSTVKRWYSLDKIEKAYHQFT